MEGLGQLEVPIPLYVVHVRLGVVGHPHVHARVRGEGLRPVAPAVPVARPRLGRVLLLPEGGATGRYATRASAYLLQRDLGVEQEVLVTDLVRDVSREQR